MLQHILSTRSVDDFEAAVSPLLGAHRMRSRGAAAKPFALQHAGFEQLSISTIRYGRDTAIEVCAPRPNWALSKVVSGRVQVGRGALQADVAAGGWMAYAPDRDDALHYDPQAQVLTLALPGAALEQACRIWLGRPAPPGGMVQHGLLAPGGAAAQLERIAERLWSSAQGPAEVPAAYLRLQEELALCELAMAFAPRGDARGALPLAGSLSASVRKACEHLRAHLDDAVSLAQLALVSGIGIRALTLAFQRELGVSPIRYHRQLRLDQARLDLLAGRGSVTDVAARWGFWNPGDFARHYRLRHGERPTDTRPARH